MALNSTIESNVLGGLGGIQPSVDLQFQPDQPVGIHFKWDIGAYRVVGFAEDSPAKKQNKIEEGYVLIMLNNITLQGVPQKVVNKMMVNCAKEARVLTFTAPPPKPQEKPKAASKPPSQKQEQQRQATRPPMPNKPPHLQRRRSHSNEYSTPARRMRIIYEFCKPLIAMYQAQGAEAAIEKMNQITAAKVIQKSIRGFLGRKFFRVAMKIRKFRAAQRIQKELRRILANSRVERMRKERQKRIEIEAATKMNSVMRMKLAMLFVERLKQARKRRRSLAESEAAAKLQSIARKRSPERLFKVVKASSRTIQKYLRGKIARAFVPKLRVRVKSATKIQAVVRRMVAADTSGRRRKAVGVLQGMARIWQAKRLVRDLREEMALVEEIENPVGDGNESVTPLKLPVVESKTPQSETPGEPAASPATTAQSPSTSVASEQSGASPEHEAFQLRFSPEAGSCLQKGEIFGNEVGSPIVGSPSPVKPKSPETPMEEKFRRERYKIEVEAREKMAVMLQSRWRGGGARELVGAMKTVAAAVSQAKNVQRCRLVVNALLKKRNDATLVIQMKMRTVLAIERTKKLRIQRLEYCAETMEKEYSITELVGIRGGEWGDWEELGEGERDTKDFQVSFDVARKQNMWLRIMPEKSRFCYGCDYFRECSDGIEDLRVEEILELKF